MATTEIRIREKKGAFFAVFDRLQCICGCIVASTEQTLKNNFYKTDAGKITRTHGQRMNDQLGEKKNIQREK